ncbi:hypothetical protein BH10PLA1_BH10PLA1_21800 [soil metagenome]
MASNASYLIWIIIAASTLCLSAAWMLRVALFPKRTGSEPRCRRCDYQLQGITSDCCPECGSILTPSNTAYGQRRRRPWLAGIGAIVLLIGLSINTILIVDSVRLRNIDWYQFYPTGWVIADISSPTPAKQSRAWVEINRRISVGQLSGKQVLSLQQLDQLADACLAALPGATRRSDPAWVELMRQGAGRQLGENQRVKLFDFALKQQQTASDNELIRGLIDWAGSQGSVPPGRSSAMLGYPAAERPSP